MTELVRYLQGVQLDTDSGSKIKIKRVLLAEAQHWRLHSTLG